MAIMNYSWDEINRLPQHAEEGEKYILHWLENNLSNEYEIFFQPYINGDRPDIVILRQNGGVVIIEVKDYDMDLYTPIDKNVWHVIDKNGNKQRILSPVSQVKRYKDNIINLHVEGLAEACVSDKKNYAIIVPCLYLHKATKEDLESVKPYADNYIYLFCKDNLDSQFEDMLDKTWISRRSKYFHDYFYFSLKKWFTPLAYEQDFTKPVTLTAEQREFGSIRNDKRYTNFCGVPGSGKTTILALKAVNSYIQAVERANIQKYSRIAPILIVTFNITLRNYIQDRISMISRILKVPFDRSAYIVLNYHEFLRVYCNNNDIHYDPLEDVNATSSYSLPKLDSKAERYDTILIDEIQDFDDLWIENLKKTLSKGGKIYRFGDNDQNIYEIDNNGKNIKNYKKLTSTFRLNSEIVALANYFKNNYLPDAENIENSMVDIFTLTKKPVLDFCDIHHDDFEEMADKISSFISECGNTAHPNDYCILGGNIDTLRNLEFELRTKRILGGNFTTMFETKEVYNKLVNEHKSDIENLKKELKRIRRSKKYNFWNNAGKAKICTIHSFKGWEAVNGVIILEEDSYLQKNLNIPFETIVYVALTRIRSNLLIINLGGLQATEYLRKYIKQYKENMTAYNEIQF